MVSGYHQKLDFLQISKKLISVKKRILNTMVKSFIKLMDFEMTKSCNDFGHSQSMRNSINFDICFKFLGDNFSVSFQSEPLSNYVDLNSSVPGLYNSLNFRTKYACRFPSCLDMNFAASMRPLIPPLAHAGPLQCFELRPE